MGEKKITKKLLIERCGIPIKKQHLLDSPPKKQSSSEIRQTALLSFLTPKTFVPKNRKGYLVHKEIMLVVGVF